MADVTLPLTCTPAAGAIVVDGQLSYEAFDAGTPVYRRTDGLWAKSRANALATADCDGIAVSSAEGANQRVSILTEGDLTLTGGTAGLELYISAAVAGKLAPRADITLGGTGTYITYVGVYTSATNFRVHIHNSGARVP